MPRGNVSLIPSTDTPPGALYAGAPAPMTNLGGALGAGTGGAGQSPEMQAAQFMTLMRALQDANNKKAAGAAPGGDEFSAGGGAGGGGGLMSLFKGKGGGGNAANASLAI